MPSTPTVVRLVLTTGQVGKLCLRGVSGIALWIGLWMSMVAAELGQAGNAALMEAGAATLGRLRELGILAGAVKSCASGANNPVLG